MAIAGLTGYEERIYSSLVQWGPLTARELHRRSGVPKNRIYDCIVSLETKGFVETQPTKPKVYKAVEPKNAFGKIRAELEHSQVELQKLYEKKRVAEKLSQLLVTQGHEAAVQARIADFRGVKKEYFAIIGKEPEATTPELAMIAREHTAALRRGVKVSILWNMEYPENVKKAERLAPFGTRIRHYPVEGFSMAIRDRQEVRVELPDKTFGRLSIWIRNAAFADAMVDYFTKCWASASDWKKFAK
jgi:sugar-specific transcriptional regulator TrmB